MLTRIRTKIKQKGQGIVEYAILLAFIVGIAMMLNSGGIRGAVKDTLDNVVVLLRGNPYAPYFQAWHDKSSAWLSANATSEERLKADQEALARIARAFIGLSEGEVKDLIKDLSVSRSGNVSFYNATNYAEGENGWSQTLVPLSYNTNHLENDTENYIHLDWAGNAETVKLLTNDVVAYKGDAADNPYSEKKNTGVNDRIFYSDGMIGDYADNKMVTLQVHYQNGVVDQVNIQARDVWQNDSTNDNNKKKNMNKYDVVDGLNLNVTKTEINQVSSSSN